MTAGPAPSLDRRLGTVDAVVVGLCAMVGAGVFAAFAPAAEAAGAGLLIGLAVAALVALCNAVASAQLAMTYPTSGGTYVYGREVLGPWWGFLAGWGFVVGKTASCAAMAMTFAAYAVPGTPWLQRAAAVAAVVVLTLANLRGVTRTAVVARVLLGATLLTLAVALAVAFGGGERAADPWAGHGGALGVLQAAGLLFFAFAGYARIATLAEEVRRPESLGRAILVALGVAVAIYVAVAVALLLVLGTDLPDTTTPISDAMSRPPAPTGPCPWCGSAPPRPASARCSRCSPDVGRTTLAMARERDLPTWLSSIHPTHRVPDHAQVVIGVAIVVLVLFFDLRGAIGFSSCGVLVYYAVANAAAFRQPADQRRWPRALNVVGLLGCLVLVATLPAVSVLVGLAVLAVGLAGRWLVRWRDAPRP